MPPRLKLAAHGGIAAPEGRGAIIAMLTAADFEPHLGTRFELTADGHEEVLTLTEVKQGRASPDLARTPFILIFNGSRSDLLLHPHVRALRHPAFESLEIDIVPTERREDGTFEYQAMFN